MKRVYLAAALAAGLFACGDGNPFTTTTPTTGGDPNTESARFLFDEGRFLTANQFTFDPAANGGLGSIVINNLPFDGVSTGGGEYTRRAGAAVLPDGGIIFENTPGPGEDQYFAVVLQSPGGTGALVGAVGTDAYRGFGYGGATAQRPSAGLPASRAAAYQYQGGYAGVRVVRNETNGTGDTIQTTTGLAQLQVDLQNLDAGGSIKGVITNHQVCDVNGAGCVALAPILLNETTIDTTNNRTNDNTADTLNTDGTQAQVGNWEGNFSGPNGEEIVGYVVIEGQIPDSDPNNVAASTVNAREVGGFVAQQVP